MSELRLTNALTVRGPAAGAARRADGQPAASPAAGTALRLVGHAASARSLGTSSRRGAGTSARRRAGGFTLIELLITISIIAIMATMVLFAMFQAQETAKAHRTRALITKLNMIIMRRYDEYRTRRVPIQFQPNEIAAGPDAMAKIRVDCLRDLMRLEMPDRWTDVLDDPVTPFNRPTNGRIQRPAASTAYLNKYSSVVGNTTWPITATNSADILDNQGAEMLYMIVMQTLAGEGDSRDFFKPTDIADTDGDQFPEFVDAWNRPIEFIRWAPGFQSPLQTPIRIQGQVNQVDPHTATVTVTGNNGSTRLNQTPGSYVGGAILAIDSASQLINTQHMARISGYKYDNSTSPPTVTFTCTSPSSDPAPFNGDTVNGEMFVTQPDPFDSRDVYQTEKTFAIYPLIYSRGKDGASGLIDDNSLFHYSTIGLNPYYVPAPGSETFGLMMGSVTRNPTMLPEQNWYYGCHNDNITNHQLTTR